MSSLAARTQRGADGMTRHVVSIGATAPAKGKRKKRLPPDPIKTNGEASAEQLRLFIERVERLEEEKAGIGNDIADVYPPGWLARAFRSAIEQEHLQPRSASKRSVTP